MNWRVLARIPLHLRHDSAGAEAIALRLRLKMCPSAKGLGWNLDGFPGLTGSPSLCDRAAIAAKMKVYGGDQAGDDNDKEHSFKGFGLEVDKRQKIPFTRQAGTEERAANDLQDRSVVRKRSHVDRNRRPPPGRAVRRYDHCAHERPGRVSVSPTAASVILAAVPSH